MINIEIIKLLIVAVISFGLGIVYAIQNINLMKFKFESGKTSQYMFFTTILDDKTGKVVAVAGDSDLAEKIDKLVNEV